MPSIGKFSVWIEVEGQRLREYSITYDAKQKTKVCWIPSEAGKKFEVYFQDEGRRFTTSYQLVLDGQCLPPFMFASCVYVDEDSPNIMVDRNLGEIKVLVHRARRLTRTKRTKSRKAKKTKPSQGSTQPSSTSVESPPPQEADNPPEPDITFPDLILSERGKKGIAHGIQLGAVEVTTPGTHDPETNVVQPPVRYDGYPGLTTPEPDSSSEGSEDNQQPNIRHYKRCATFIFKYRPYDVLLAEGHVRKLRIPRQPRTSSSATQSKLARTGTDSAAAVDDNDDDQDDAMLDERLEVMRKECAKLQKKLQPRPKPVFQPKQEITDDADDVSHATYFCTARIKAGMKMPTRENFSVWIEVEGRSLPEFKIKVSKQEKVISCWVPSELNKPFEICVHDSQRTYSSAFDVRLDGNDVSCGRVIVKSDEETKRPSTRVKGYRLTKRKMQPLYFSKCVLLDENTFNPCVSGQMGQIEVEVEEVRLRKIKATPLEKLVIPPLFLNERVHKGIDHGIQAGEVQKSDDPYPTFSTQRIRLIGTFIFKYRPLEVLRANGVLPRPLNLRPPTVGPIEVIDLTREAEELEQRVQDLKAFEICVHHEPRSFDVGFSISIDGREFPCGEIIYCHSNPDTAPYPSSRVKGCSQRRGWLQPFVFSNCIALEEGKQEEEDIKFTGHLPCDHDKIGEIRVTIWRVFWHEEKCEQYETVPDLDYMPPIPTRPLQLNERAYKMAEHCSTLGAARRTKKPNPRRKVSDDTDKIFLESKRVNIVSFVFKYRSLAMLRADGIAPRLVHPEIIDLTQDSDTEEESTARDKAIAFLQNELKELRTESIALKRRLALALGSHKEKGV
ncbi:hypothetical protein CVT24_006034 [Panaeolus cyanescens]|uniref:DUF7918 domain-containing protein n=1 Tax=Panaeolus cyanescens TaxID=181874 RepID=A0A409YE48_9AGAR|nr:hypothetical protein CVT24_006034 [Panaeolus cyanescens]